MSVRIKSLLVIGLTLLGLVGILYVSSRAILLDSYARLEERDTHQNIERALNAIADDLSTLNRTANDYAAWDDTYNFAADRNEEYLTANYSLSTFTNIRVSLLLITNTSGQILFSKSVDLETEQETTLPKRWQAEVLADDRLLRSGNDKNSLSGLILFPEGPLLIAVQPILQNASQGTPRGSLIMGRALDDHEIKRLSDTTRLALSLYRVDDPQLPTELQTARAALTEPVSALVRPLDESTVAGYAILKDIYDQPALILRLTLDREVYRQGQSSLSYFMLSLLIVGFVFGVVALLLLERIVLARLASLSADVTHIGEAGDFSGRVTAAGRDELSHLAKSINDMLAALERLKRLFEIEEEKVERLLLNILPFSIAERLKEEEGTIADSFPDVTILFADIVDFTKASAAISPEEMVATLNEVFSAFDQLAEKHGLEKIKTIGDAYMVVGGLPDPRLDHAEAMAEMALDMQTELARINEGRTIPISVRIGLNTGPVVAGVIGTKKFLYDLWGDTVNTASRMESFGVSGRIQVTEATYQRLRERYEFEERGTIAIKGKGEMMTYLMVRRQQV